MQINIDYDSSINSAPAGFESGVQTAVQYLDSEFTNAVTLTIDVGYGEIDGQPLGVGALGESEASQYDPENYSAVRNALLAQNAPGSSTLPTSSPLSGTLFMAQAEAKALGLPQNNDPIDGYVGFSSSPGIFSYANGATPPSNEYYFIGVVEHEITEDMGRVSFLGDQPHDYASLDLFRYSSLGVRDLTAGHSGSTAYFSTDNGSTNLGTWNNDPNNGDLADWYPSGPAAGGDDAFNDYSSPGVVNTVSTDDVTLMRALGWTTTPSTSAPVPGNVDEWLLSNGHWAAAAEPGSIASGYESAGVGDFTGGGTDGVLWYNSSTGDVSEWEIGNAAVVGSIDLGTHPGSYQIVGVGDFFGNGIDDVVWTSTSGGNVQIDIWKLNSSGQWAASFSPGSHPAGYSVAGVGDWTGSGTDGILWYDASTGNTDEWQLKNGQWSANVNLGSHPGSGWTIAGVGDFFDNGRDDVLWTNASGGSVQTDIWELGSNGQWTASVSPGFHPAGYQVAGIGDFTGNGTSDILWYNASTGDADEWLIKKGQWSASVDLGAHPGNFLIAGVGDFTATAPTTSSGTAVSDGQRQMR